MALNWKAILERSGVFAVLFFCQCVFGGYSVVSKIALQDNVDPIIFAFIRDIIATPILLFFAWFFEKLPLPAPEDRFTFLILGFVGIYGNQLFYILGVDYTTAVNASLLQPSIPVFTSVLGILVGLEVLRWWTLHGALKILGICAAVGGAIVVITLSDSTSEEASNLLLGNICLVTNCVCTAIYVLIQKKILEKYPPITTTAYAYFFGTCCLFCSVIGGQGNPDRWKLPVSAIWALAYAALLSSVLCYSLSTWANKRTSPSIVTAFYPLQVVASATLSSIIFQSVLNIAEILGSILVIVGLFCVVASKQLEEIWVTKHLPPPPPSTLSFEVDKETSINSDQSIGERSPLVTSTTHITKYD